MLVLAASSMVAAQSLPTLASRIAARQQRQTEAVRKSSGNTAGRVIGVIIGAGAAALCGAFDRDNSDRKRALCTVAGTAAGLVTALLGKEISKKLKENDQKKVLAAAGESLRTGEPQTLVLPESGASATVTPVGTAVTKEIPVDIFYDSARMAQLEPIEVVASLYKVTGKASLRASPDAKAPAKGDLARDQVLHVAGKVKGQPWYMVSERVFEGQDSALMAIGYVPAIQLAPAPASAQLTAKPMPSTLAEGQVSAVLQCGTRQIAVRDAKGTTKIDAVRCLGPSGDVISA